jgi:hypothetical protein
MEVSYCKKKITTEEKCKKLLGKLQIPFLINQICRQSFVREIDLLNRWRPSYRFLHRKSVAGGVSGEES